MKRRKSTSKKPPLWSKFTQSRQTCRACGDPLDDILDLGEQEIINLGDKERRKAPLVLAKCVSCSLVQLRYTVDRDYLFRNYYYRSGATQTMKDHLKGVVEDVMKRVELKEGDGVVDIGSNDGTLLSFYPQSLVRMGFEPSIKRGAHHPYPFHSHLVRDFFNKSTYDEAMSGKHPLFDYGLARAITAIAMFYDLDDPNAFLQDVKRVLAPDGLLVLQVNYLPDTLRNNAVGDICHEHLCYYKLTTLLPLLDKNGLEANDVSFNQINGGSIRLFITHKHTAATPFGYSTNKTVGRAILNEGHLDSFSLFADRISAITRKTREYVETLSKLGKTVSVIGASTRGATFLQYARLNRYGILIDCVERDPSKVGKHYLGMPIVSEGADWDNPSDWYLLVMPWLEKEVRERMPWVKRLILPLPEPRIVVDGIETPL